MRSADYAVARCLSVCHTWYSVDTAEHILKIFLPSGRSTILFFSLLNGMAIEILPPLGGPGRNIAITFGAEKVKGCGYSFSVLTQWCGKQMVNKFDDKFDDNVYSFRYNTQTWRTDGQTPHNGIVRALHSFLSFFLIWCGTRSLRMPALRPASQAGPMLNPREGTSVVLRDTIRLTWWCV